MQLAIDIPNENIAKKIITILKAFEDDGVKIKLFQNRQKSYNDDFETMKETIASWQKDIMTNEDPSIDDDEILPQAYWEYNSEKYIDR